MKSAFDTSCSLELTGQASSRAEKCTVSARPGLWAGRALQRCLPLASLNSRPNHSFQGNEYRWTSKLQGLSTVQEPKHPQLSPNLPSRTVEAWHKDVLNLAQSVFPSRRLAQRPPRRPRVSPRSPARTPRLSPSQSPRTCFSPGYFYDSRLFCQAAFLFICLCGQRSPDCSISSAPEADTKEAHRCYSLCGWDMMCKENHRGPYRSLGGKRHGVAWLTSLKIRWQIQFS